MNTATIIKLIDAGYTKAEIQAMDDFPAEQEAPDQPADAADQPAAAAPAAEEPAPDQPADAADQPAAAAPAAEEPAVQPAGYDAVLEALNKLTNSIIKSNINSTVAVQPAEHTLDAALASIIAPPMKKTK